MAKLSKRFKKVTDGVDPLSDLAAAADYRAHLAQVYTGRALAAAFARAA